MLHSPMHINPNSYTTFVLAKKSVFFENPSDHLFVKIYFHLTVSTKNLTQLGTFKIVLIMQLICLLYVRLITASNDTRLTVIKCISF